MRSAQTCPRRLESPGPWRRGEGLDRWRSRTWGWAGTRWWDAIWFNDPQSRLYRLREWLKPLWGSSRRYTRTGGWPKWAYPWQPRTCSFCGGAHPMDVIRLLSEGWEMEWTDKGYKLYLNPPGTRAVRRQAQAALQRGADPLKAYHPVFQTWSPAPPVKVYLQHLDDDHRTRAENAAQSYRATEAATS